MPKETTIADKVKALLAQAQSAKEIGNLEEADAFAAKANSLLLKHNLDRAKLIAEMGQENDKFSGWLWSEKVITSENLAGDRWRRDLAKVLAYHNLCGVLQSNPKERGPKYLKFYGLAENVESVVFLYNFLETIFMVMAKESRANLPKEEREKVCRHTYLKDWLLGAIEGLHAKLEKERRTAEYAQAIGQLIIYNDKALGAFLKKESPGAFEVMPRSIEVKANSAYDEGYAVGSTIETKERRLSNVEETAKSKLLTDKKTDNDNKN